MAAAGQHAQDKGVVRGDVDQHIVRQNGRIQKDENTVLGRFHGGDVARQTVQGWAEGGAHSPRPDERPGP